MYTKHGFTVRQRLADHYYIDGAYWDAFHMAKPLPDARKRAPRQFCVLL